MSSHRKILITGSTGFIGRHLLERLINDGFKTTCIVRKTSDVSFLKTNNIDLVYADITDYESFKQSIKNLEIDVLIHCAAYVKNKNSSLLFKVNVKGTENVCRICIEQNIERMIYLSSVAVVSGNEIVPLHENLPYKATNLYGFSKIEAEKVVLNYRKNRGLKVYILRPCMVYGEGEPHAFGLLLRLLKLRLLPIVGKGDKKLHLVYVKNVVEAVMKGLNNPIALEGTYFVADEEVLSTKEIFELICKYLNTSPPYRLPSFLLPFLKCIPFINKRINFFLKDRVYNTNRIKSLLKFTAPFSVYQGLERSVKYWLNNKSNRYVPQIKRKEET